MAVTDCMSLIHSQLPYSSKRGTDIPTKMHAYDSSDSASRVESGKGRPKRLQGAVHSVDKVTINATRGSSIRRDHGATSQGLQSALPLELMSFVPLSFLLLFSFSVVAGRA